MRTPLLRSLAAVFTAALTLSLLAGCGSSGDTRDGHSRSASTGNYGTSTFPVPEEIAPNVDFWRHVYGVWSRGQVAIHDDEHMGLIYEVVRLPGPIKGGYTAQQKALVKGKVASYRSQLAVLRKAVSTGTRLSPSQKTLMKKIERAGGRSVLFGAADRVRGQRGLRERFRRGVEISGAYLIEFREAMRRYGVPEDLAYLPHVESSFQPHARSGVGASGMWQFMKGTGKMYMTVNSSVDQRLDPVLSADAAARYLHDSYRKLHSWPLAVTSYNHGRGGMAKAKAAYGDDIGRIVRNYKGKHFKFASRNFYAEFVAAREVAVNAKRYFPEGVRYQKPIQKDRIRLHSGMPAGHLARHYGTSVTRLADLNPSWRSSVINGARYVPPGSPVWLPPGTTRRVAQQPRPPVRPVAIAAAPKPKAKSAARSGSRTLARLDPPKRSKVKAPSKRKVAKATPKKAKVVKARYHVVKPGETLYRISREYDLSIERLRKLNRLASGSNSIRSGQRLRVSI